MKFGFLLSCVMLFTALQTLAVSANELNDLQEYRAEAEQYYKDQDFKKAYKMYYKLAKGGDHFSQDRVSKMFANGEGKEVDLDEAYAWSVLAAEGGKANWVGSSEELLQLTQDQTRAQGKADKLMKKYGEQALMAKAENRAKREHNRQHGSCTGSRLACSDR